MKRFTLGLCMLALVLWAGPSVLAQGQGKGGGKERGPQAGKTQDQAPAAETTTDKNVGKGKAGKGGDSAPAAEVKTGKNGGKGKASKQDESDAASRGPQGKKAEQGQEGKGKGPEQKMQALQKQLQQAQAKHLERQARLQRIRELAVEKKDAEMIARVDKLLAQENKVFTRKQQHGQGQPRTKAVVRDSNAVSERMGQKSAPEPNGVPQKEEKDAGKQAPKAEEKK